MGILYEISHAASGVDIAMLFEGMEHIACHDIALRLHLNE